jgi:hypothetical protein
MVRTFYQRPAGPLACRPCLTSGKPQAAVVEAVRGRASEAAGGTHVPADVEPGTAAQDTVFSFIGSNRIDYRLLGVRPIPIDAPFPDIAVHFIESPTVAGESLNRNRFFSILTFGAVVVRIMAVKVGLPK